MAHEGKHRKPDTSGFRIWPGVTLIAVCGFLVFLAVYVIAYKADLIPLPDYVEALFRRDTDMAETAETRYDEMDALLLPQETDSRVIFSPAEEDPAVWFASHTLPTQYYQRMQIIYRRNGQREEITAEVYRKDDCWKLTKQENGTEQTDLYLCDGTMLYRKTRTGANETVTGKGSFTPENILGLPDLLTLQQKEKISVSFVDNGVHMQFFCETEEGIQCAGLIAVDTGLITEVQIRQDGETLLVMYTDLYDMAPAALRQTDFFTIPENGGIDR